MTEGLVITILLSLLALLVLIGIITNAWHGEERRRRRGDHRA